MPSLLCLGLICIPVFHPHSHTHVRCDLSKLSNQKTNKKSSHTLIHTLITSYSSLSSFSFIRKPQVEAKREKEPKKPVIKKPLNAFMLYMKEMRAKVIAECTLKESAAINQILGRRVRGGRAHTHTHHQTHVRAVKKQTNPISRSVCNFTHEQHERTLVTWTLFRSLTGACEIKRTGAYRALFYSKWALSSTSLIHSNAHTLVQVLLSNTHTYTHIPILKDASTCRLKEPGNQTTDLPIGSQPAFPEPRPLLIHRLYNTDCHNPWKC